MKIEWHEIEPGTYEARASAWLLEVSRSDDADPWCVWVGMMLKDRREGGLFFRDHVTGSLEEAQRAAVAFAVEKCSPFLAVARAEAALAEREACAAAIEKLLAEHRANMVEACCPRHRGDASLMADACHRGADAIRARTTPATLSTDTLDAIAKARGLRVVKAEQLADLEALREVPVLTWRYTGNGEHTASVIGWELTASERNWCLIHSSGAQLLSPRPNLDNAGNNMVSAENALRALGVAFRVEGDEPRQGTAYQTTGSHTSGGQD